MERLEIKLSKELKTELQNKAKKLNISVSSYVRMKLSGHTRK